MKKCVALCTLLLLALSFHLPKTEAVATSFMDSVVLLIPSEFGETSVGKNYEFTQDQTLISNWCSGVAISNKAIMTAAHCVYEPVYGNIYEKLIVCVPGRECSPDDYGMPLAYDKDLDLAIVGLFKELPMNPATIGNSSLLQQGDDLKFVGYPNVGSAGVTSNVSKGLASSFTYTDNYFMSKGQKMVDQQYIKTDAQLSPGYSGGGVFNEDGKLVGIINAEDPISHEIGFSTPIMTFWHWIMSLDNTQYGSGDMQKIKQMFLDLIDSQSYAAMSNDWTKIDLKGDGRYIPSASL